MRYQQVCPVSLASEVIAERWTPLILREIVLFGNHHFSEIQRGVGRVQLDGPPDLVRGFPRWLGESRFARHARPASPLTLAPSPATT